MIETERLRLRNWTAQDCEPFHRHTNTPAVMRWLGGVKPREVLDGIILDRFMPWQETRGHTFWAVERKSDAELLGFCGLKIADDPGSPVEGELEVGWRLREDAWGQGFAREAATASLDFAFRTLAARQVVALTVSFLGVAALFQLFDGAQVIGSAMLRGLQDTRVPMIFAGLGYWVVGLGSGYLLAFHAGLRGLGVWIGLALGLAVVAVLMIWRWALRERLGLVPTS